MRDGIFIVDGDGHVMDFPHPCYQKYLPEQYRRHIAFFPGAYWDRRQAPNGDMGRDPNTPEEMLADLAQEGIKSFRATGAPWSPGFPARRPVPFDHAYGLWQDRRTMSGALSAPYRRGEEIGEDCEGALCHLRFGGVRYARAHRQHPLRHSVDRPRTPSA